MRLLQVNLLSKVDLVEAYGQLAFNLDFYTEVTPELLCTGGVLAAATPVTDSAHTHHIALGRRLCRQLACLLKTVAGLKSLLMHNCAVHPRHACVC